jgi:hypothetical protein
VDLSGIIFVVLALAWAVYLLPKALRQGDEVARSRAVDGSPSSRVLARREAVSPRDARLVVGPGARTATAAPPAAGAPIETPVERVAVRRASARVAARRRRRMLGLLLLCTLATAVASYVGHLPRWSAAVPAVVVLGRLLLCRTQVRRQAARPTRLRRPVTETPTAEAAAPTPVATPVADETPVAAPSSAPTGSPADDDESEDTVGIAVADLAAIAPGAPAPSGDVGSVWDPLPVTLPTYVTAPKARRTVRTIDLGEPGTWTSGRTAEDAEIAARASATEECGTASEEPGSRAVGS